MFVSQYHAKKNEGEEEKEEENISHDVNIKI